MKKLFALLGLIVIAGCFQPPPPQPPPQIPQLNVSVERQRPSPPVIIEERRPVVVAPRVVVPVAPYRHPAPPPRHRGVGVDVHVR